MRRITTLLSAAALGAVALAPAAAQAGTTSATSGDRHPVKGTAADGYDPPPITWGDCSAPPFDDYGYGAFLAARGAECGMLVVPLDYADPAGEKISIAVSRIEHTSSDADFQGPMLVNPGGPGGSGLVYSYLGGAIPNGAGDAYDWIGFDPRGVGQSEPALSCAEGYFPADRPDYIPSTSGIEQFWLDKTADYADACAAKYGDMLDHLKTTDNVADMESLRKALGAAKINYYGFSYGTYLGQVYATQHPDRVGRMVFDGVVNPKDVWYRANLNQDTAFEKSMRIWFDWIAAHDATYHLGTDGDHVRALFYDMREKARAASLGGKIGPAEWTDAFLGAGYYVYGWEGLAEAFAAAVHGDYGPVIDAYGNPGEGGYPVYLGTECTDDQWPTAWPRWEADNWRVHRIAPYETWANAWYNAPCHNWAGAASQNPVHVDGKDAPPILLIEETYDAATPFAGALEVRQRFPKSVLIEGVGGTTHAGSLSGVACTDDRIAAYLATGALDARKPGRGSDVECPPVPAPDPAPSAARSLAPSTTAPESGMPAILREGIIAAVR